MSHVQTRAKTKQKVVESNGMGAVNSKGGSIEMYDEVEPETDCELHANSDNEDSSEGVAVNSDVDEYDEVECSVEACSGTGNRKLKVASRPEVASVRAEVLAPAGMNPRTGSKSVRAVDNLVAQKGNRKLLKDSGCVYVGVADVSTGAVNKFCTDNVNPNVGQTTRKLPLGANRKQKSDSNFAFKNAQSAEPDESTMPVFVSDLNVVQGNIPNVVKEVTQNVLPDFAKFMAELHEKQKELYDAITTQGKVLREENRKLQNDMRAEFAERMSVFDVFLQDQGTVSQSVIQSNDPEDGDNPLTSALPLDPQVKLVNSELNPNVQTDRNVRTGGNGAFIKRKLPSSIDIGSDRSYAQFKRACQAKPVQDASSDVTGNSNDDALQGRRRHNSDDQIIRNSPEVQYKSFRNVKLPRFNGEQPGEFEVFLLQFETYATNMGLADRERMNAMRMALYGQAAKMILRYNHLSYGEFVAELKKSYGAENQEEYYRAKLMTYKRKPEEEISQLKLQLENIATHAFPGECNSKLYRENLVDAFMESLSEYPVLQV